mmetsp:Transcript_81211/g.159381  ORF Transcript_81211/g.159381 Transcript_81211/m.159381 type:complete len:380 (-) Transcript_81211:101-1240(-)|eukprot:CAMPEP_0170361832 /NCGR_PEP_ID=MMETSP0117_2-20130122/4012_1 /TAXON_ID=400756 /ORGANISM="Durinskia baltica, Strain CSIRO CS-38" /LENGTH=379 /DNA_ID=CAMNT_0010616215 /DNA_START=22 /DNA_END=1161 /DNA_ORIENTATION=+
MVTVKISFSLQFIVSAVLVFLAKSDILYLEGFYNHENLPGGNSDPTRPNTPFSTDTNRFADGFTSTGAYDSASPRFPVYAGASANVSDRYKRYTQYIESAAEQGISPFGAGDRVREEARLRITNEPDYLYLPRPGKTFPVLAAIKWNPSDFAIQEGETYNVTVLGSDTGYSDQFWYDGGLRVNSVGYDSYFDAVSNCYVGMGRCRPHLKKKRRLPSANWMSLACAIGEFVRPLVEVEPGSEETYRWMPLDESTLQETIFDVGRHVTFRAVFTGQLICFANDAHSQYWNNYGQIDVSVTRVSWPPSNQTVYQEALLPSCDSAQVVYVNKGDNTPGPGKVACNPNGGGAGWKLADVLNTKGGYGSGAPEELFFDLPDYIKN